MATQSEAMANKFRDDFQNHRQTIMAISEVAHWTAKESGTAASKYRSNKMPRQTGISANSMG